MQRSSIPMGVGSLKKWQEKGTLNFDLPYQRHAGVWSPFQKSMLVYSIFRDSYIPPLVFLKFTDGESPVYSVLDGQQRLTTLFDFIDGKWKLHAATPDIEFDDKDIELAGKTFEDLEPELMDILTGFRFTIQAIEGFTDEDAEELFSNINSGVALSTIQKAKPALGGEVCEWINDILKLDFFSQAINITANQAQREEDFGMILQSLILIDASYDDWKSLSTAECLKYASYLRNRLDADFKKYFFDIISFLNGVFNEKTKYLRKNNVAVIIKLTRIAVEKNIDKSSYKLFLDDFFSDSSGEYQDLYKEYSGSGNVKRVNVEGRFDALLNYFLETFDEFLKATDDDGLRMEEISEVS